MLGNDANDYGNDTDDEYNSEKETRKGKEKANTDDIFVNIDQISGIAHENLGKLISRGDQLHDIKGKADMLGSVTEMFKKKARTVKSVSCLKQFQDQSVFIVYVCIGVLLFVMLITALWGASSNKSPYPQPNYPGVPAAPQPVPPPTTPAPPSTNPAPPNGQYPSYPQYPPPQQCVCVCPSYPQYPPGKSPLPQLLDYKNNTIQ